MDDITGFLFSSEFAEKISSNDFDGYTIKGSIVKYALESTFDIKLIKKLSPAQRTFAVYQMIQDNKNHKTTFWHNGHTPTDLDLTKYVTRDIGNIVVNFDNTQKATLLINAISERLNSDGKSIFDEFSFIDSDFYKCNISPGTESYTWISYLTSEKLISNSYKQVEKTFADYHAIEKQYFDENNKHFKLNPNALQLLKKSNLENNNKVFIAMDFKISNKEEIVQTIKKALALRFDAYTIDEDPHNDWITEKIMVGIQKCKFIIADFSTPNAGVYFEAGYARGLGKQVIHLAPQKVLDKRKLHFDTAQINHIAYKDMNELEDKLRDKVTLLYPEKN